jgi:uncharacterized cupin superfamily protein
LGYDACHDFIFDSLWACAYTKAPVAGLVLAYAQDKLNLATDKRFMAAENPIEFGTAAVILDPLPIHASWILEGAPVAQAKVISRSSDGTARTIVWDCTAGRFNWFYDIDETVYVLEGSALIKDQTGTARLVSAGQTILFRAGSQAEWTVENYIRKIAFFRNPVPSFALLGIRIVRAAKKLLPLGGAKRGVPSMADG